MDMKLREFRKQTGEENRGRPGLGRRYSGELRLAAVAYLKRKNGEGESLERVASELGVSNWRGVCGRRISWGCPERAWSRRRVDASGTVRGCGVHPRECVRVP